MQRTWSQHAIDTCIPMFTRALLRISKTSTCVHVSVCTITCLWRPKDSFVESYLFVPLCGFHEQGCQTCMASALHPEPFYQPHSCLFYLSVRAGIFLCLQDQAKESCLPLEPKSNLFPLACLISSFVPLTHGKCKHAPGHVLGV